MAWVVHIIADQRRRAVANDELVASVVIVKLDRGALPTYTKSPSRKTYH
jgi:hypothetical protein